jgi:hypothetical protein
MPTRRMTCSAPFLAAMAGALLLFFGAESRTETNSQAPAPQAAPPSEPATEGGPPIVRLINDRQYANAVADIFGPDVNSTNRFPPMRRTDGLVALGASTAVVTPGALEVFDTVGRDVASQVVDENHRGSLIPCKPADPKKADEACARLFLSGAGRLLFRRPLTAEELETHTSAAQRAAESLHDFYAGLGSALSGMLVAPQFLYFVERTEPDPERPGVQRLDSYSQATRLSLLLWNSPPDSELLRAAEAGELHSSKALGRQLDRMIASPRLKAGVRAYFEDLMIMENFDTLAKDPVLYPAFTLKVANESKEQTLRIVIDQLVTRRGDYRDLFITRNTFLTQDLGAIYRLPVRASGSLDWVPYEVPAQDPRVGLLTQSGFLAVNAHTGRTSATRRGRALREIFMCQKVPDPPPNVDFSIVEDPHAKFATARERLSAHATNPVCAGCHKITDPIGLGLENFDGAGQYREREGTTHIDASGQLDGVTYTDAKGLAMAVRNNPNITSCAVKRLYEYAVGREVTKGEKPVLKYFEQRFAGEDYRFVALLRTIAASDAFYQVNANQVDKNAKVASMSQPNSSSHQ